MFLSLDNSTTQNIVVHATDNRGTLDTAIIKLTSVIDETQSVSLTKSNTSTKRNRFDQFSISPSDYASLPSGDIKYTVQAAPGGNIDDSLILDRGRGRIAELFNNTEKEYNNTSEAKIYERG